MTILESELKTIISAYADKYYKFQWLFTRKRNPDKYGEFVETETELSAASAYIDAEARLPDVKNKTFYTVRLSNAIDLAAEPTTAPRFDDPAREAMLESITYTDLSAEYTAYKDIVIPTVATLPPPRDNQPVTPPVGGPVWKQNVKWNVDTSGVQSTINTYVDKLNTYKEQAVADLQPVKDALQKGRIWYNNIKSLADTGCLALQNGSLALQKLPELIPIEAGARFLMTTPVQGGIPAARKAAIEAMSVELANAPIFAQTSYTAGIICIMSAPDTLGALVSWVQSIYTMLGNNAVALSKILDSLDTPLLSPLSTTLQNDLAFLQAALAQAVEPAKQNIDALSTLPESIGKTFESWYANTSAFQVFAKDSPLSKFLNASVSSAEAALDRLKDFQVQLDILPATPDNKIPGEKPDLLENPYNTWINLTSFADLFGGLGDTIKKAQSMLDQVTKGCASESVPFNFELPEIAPLPGIPGFTDDFGLSMQGISLQLKNQLDFHDLKLDGVNLNVDFAIDMLQASTLELKSPTFNILLVPPKQGGAEYFRLTLEEWLSDHAENVPPIPADSTAIVVMLVFGAASSPVVDTVYGLATKFFQT